MRVYVGSDHAGFDLKQLMVAVLPDHGYEVVDVGAADYDPEDDYPGFCLHTADRVVKDPGSLGVVIGGSGNGEQISANKVAGVRAALAWNLDTARLARSHNDANVVSIGARQHTMDEAMALVLAFLAEPFSGDPRHMRRIGEITSFEQSKHLPAI